VRDRLVKPFCERSGVRVLFSGHEHNFQHTSDGGMDFFVTGGGGDVRLATPQWFTEAKTKAWGKGGHFLVVKIDGDRMEVTPVGEAIELPIQGPDGKSVTTPIVVTK
jgi:tartrate-resistant acid phosphatase type 5